VAFQGAEEKQPALRRILIPKTAVHQRDGRDVVWIARDGRVEKRAVTVAAPRGDEVTVSAGLTGSERVVVEGADKLVEGARITEAKR